MTYRTWFALWMDMEQISIQMFARMSCYSDMSVKRWRGGSVMGRHAAQLIRARWPEAPLDRRGGRIPLISEFLPICARTPKLYKFMFKKLGMVSESTPVWSVALEKARGIKVGSKAEQVAVPSGEVDPDGV